MFKTAFLCLTLAILVSCSSEKKASTESPSQPTANPAVKEAQYDTGRTAFQRMFVAARAWATDVRPFRLQSQYTTDAPTAEGKAGLWRASFASPSKRMMKLFVWSGLVGPDAPEQGVTFSSEDTWNPTNSSTRIFDLGFLKIDSDTAYEVAQKHGGEKLTAKDLRQPVFFLLDWDTQKSELVWHVIYGNSEDEAKL